MKALLFDMDGVLVDVSASYRVAIVRTVEHFSGIKLSAARIQAYKDAGGFNNDWELTRQALRDLGVEVTLQEVIPVFQQFYVGDNFDGLIRYERWLLRPETAARLRASYALGVVTGRPRREAEWTVKRAEMQTLFGTLVTMDDIPPWRQKPHPDGLLLAMEHLGASEGWYVGDTVDDIIAAKRARLVPIAVAGGLSQQERTAREALLCSRGAIAVIDDVNCVEAILK